MNTGSSAAALSHSRSKEKIVNLKLIPYSESKNGGNYDRSASYSGIDDNNFDEINPYIGEQSVRNNLKVETGSDSESEIDQINF